jgi:hypothetical protein
MILRERRNTKKKTFQIYEERDVGNESVSAIERGQSGVSMPSWTDPGGQMRAKGGEGGGGGLICRIRGRDIGDEKQEDQSLKKDGANCSEIVFIGSGLRMSVFRSWQ